LEPGDFLLLCSDGLTDLVSNEEINAALGQKKPLPEVLDGLIEDANAKGGHDNITVIGIQFPDEELFASAPRSRSRIWLILILVAFLAAVLLGGWYFQSYLWEGESPTATIHQGATAVISTPAVTLTALPPTPTQTAPQVTEEATMSPAPPETGVPATYTPWPTSTTGP
jgi:hypothetical protein